MKIDSLNVLSEMINKDGFFEAVILSVNDWDEALDERDGTDFDSAWIKSFEELKVLKYKHAGDELKIKELREFAFKKIFSLTNNSEVSGYISDDIGLVADSVSKSHDIEWVDELFERYVSGRFPR